MGNGAEVAPMLLIRLWLSSADKPSGNGQSALRCVYQKWSLVYFTISAPVRMRVVFPTRI